MSDNPFALSNIEPQQDSAPASDNPFALGAIQRDQRQDLRVNLESAVRTNPQQAAEAARLAKKYETPDEVLLRNLQDVKLRDAVAEADKKLQTSPRLADYMRTSPFAIKQAHDDLDNLIKINGELKAWNGPEPTARNIVSGLAQSLPQGFRSMRAGMQAQMGDFLEWTGLVTPDPVYKADQQRKLAQAVGAKDFTTPNFESSTASAIYGGVDSTLRMLPGLAGSVATRSSVPLMASIGVQTQAEAYGKYRARGGTPLEALAGGTGEAAVEVVTEMPAMKFLTGALGRTGAGEFVSGLLARELPMEQVATFLQDAIDTAVANPDKTWEQFVAERPGAAYETLISTLTQSAIMGGVSEGARRLTKQANDQNAAQVQVQKLTAAMQAAEASTLRTNNPDEFRAVMEHLAQDGKVYVDAQVLNQLPPEQLQALGVAESLPEALAANSSVEVKLSDLLTHAPGTPAAQVLIDNARATPDGLSAIEAQQASDQAGEFIKTEAERVLAEAQDATAWQDSTNKVKQGVLDQLNSAGRFSPEVNEAYATLQSSFFSVMAQRLGTTPEELFARYNLRVEAKLPGQVERLDQGGDVGLALNTLTRDDLEDDQVFSKPLPDVDSEDLGYVKKLGANSVGSGGFHVYVKGEDVREAGPHEFYFYDNSDEPIGFARLTKTRDQASVNMIAFTEDARGSGYGKAFYKYLLDELGVSVKSDKEITEGTAALYRSLAKEYGASVDSDGRVVISKQPNQSPAQPLPDTIEVDGKQRPTTNSNGQPIAATEEGVRNFWKWFGESAATERAVSSKQRRNELRPLVVYHGTRASFDSFAPVREGNVTTMFGDEETVTRRGIFFAESSEFADTFAKQAGEGNANVVPVYLKIENPLYLDEGFTDEVISELVAAGLPDEQAARLRYRKADMAWAEFDDEDGAAMVSAIRAAGYDGALMVEPGVGVEGEDAQTVWVALDPTQIKSAIGNNGEFDPANPNILMQSGNERDLIVAHNLTSDNLRNALELGGLPAPSLAITKVDSPIQGFGEITLVGDTKLAKPSAKNPVFNADVYSPRFPDVRVKVDDRKVVATLFPLHEAAKDVGLYAISPDRVANEMERNQFVRSIGDVVNDTGMRYGYAVHVLGKDIDVPKKSVEVATDLRPTKGSIVTQEPLAGVLASIPDFGKTVTADSEESAKIAQALYSAMLNRFIGEEAEKGNGDGVEAGAALANRRIKMFAEGEGESVEMAPGVTATWPERMTLSGLSKLWNIWRAQTSPGEVAPQPNKPRQEVDIEKLSTMLDEVVDKDQMRQWVRDQLAPTIGEKRIVKDDGKTAAYSLQNIVKVMTGKVRDAEGFNYGLGNARSKGAKAFKSIADIQANRDQVQAKVETDAAIKDAEARFSNLSDELDQYLARKGSIYSPGSFEALVDAIGLSYAQGMDSALNMAGFRDVPANLTKKVQEFAAELTNLPTEYFEAKPQRAVGVDEFRGALIPDTTPTDVRTALTDMGLTLVEYRKGDEASRAQAARALAEQLDAETKDVLFQTKVANRGSSNQSTQPLPDTIEVDGKQRSTTNSNGQPIAATEEGVRNFWKWFGDSKVVDASGKPLVVYHGTASDFTEFKPSRSGNLGPGIYFTPDIEQAQAYARTHQGAQVVEAYLSVQNPLRIDNSNTSSEQLYGAFPGKSDAETVANMRAAGYDAVWAVNSVETRWGPTTREIAVYDPTQIKSAISNSGEFDPANPSILAQNSQAPRGTYSPSQVLITLGESADLSTFLHESGHFFLEVMADLASQPGAPAGVVDDFNTFLKWAGVKGDENVGGADSGTPLAQTSDVSERVLQAEQIIAGIDTEEQTVLYHSGDASIDAQLAEGIDPTFGPWLEEVLAGSVDDEDTAAAIREQDPVAFYSEEPTWVAMKVAKVLRKPVRDVTVDDIRQHGQISIVVVDQDDSSIWREQGDGTAEQFTGKARRSYTMNEVPFGVERGDVFTTDAFVPEITLTGDDLVRFLQRNAPGKNNLPKAQTFTQNGPVPEARPVQVKRTPLETWNAMTLDQKRPYHEKWAESFEQYLLEGKAPTAELQPLFRRFSAWLKNVYKSLTEFMRSRNLQVSDEIRGVFDRMLAAEDQIKAAEQAAGMLPDFEATNEAIEKLQARSLRDLKWTVGARSKALKALQREAANLRKAVKAEVTAEVEQMPEFKAQREIAEFKRENKRKANDVERAIIAEANGFESADAMTKAIDLAGKKADMIEGKTDQRMLENFGELATPEALEAAANDAVHNEARARALATELKAQADMLNPRQDTGRTASNGRAITVNALTAAAKQFAQNLTARRRVKDLKNAAWQHRSAESRAAKAWQEATAKGKTEEAVAAKRDQLLNNYTAKAMGEAQAEVRKVLEFFAKVTKGNNEKLVDKGRDPDVVNAARAVLAAYDVAPRLEKTANDYMEAVAKYDAQMYGALKPGLDAMLANAKPFGELTVDEMRALRDEIGSMWELAKTSRQMEIDGDRVDIDDAAQDLVNRMVEIGVPDEIPGEKGAITNRQELGIKLQFAKAILSRVEQWAERMDGKFGGPFLRYVFQPVKDAADRYRTARVQHREKFTKLVEGVAPFIKPGPIAAPELGYTFGNARDSGMAELLHALIHTGNDSNKRKLLLGRNWATENADGTLDTTRWDTFVARLISEGTLRKEHYDFAQGVWDLLEETKPLAQEAHRKVFGRYFAEVTANEFTTPFGVYRGGYAPAQTDSRLVGDAKLRELAEGENESMAYAFPSAPSGFTKSRVEYNKPLLLDLRALAQHMDKVLLFSHMQPAIADARRLLTRKNVSYALDRIDPGAYEGMLTPWLARSAKQIVETPIAGDRRISRFMGAVRSRAGMALMMANLSNTVQQITGFSTAAIKVKPSLMLKAVGQFTASPKEFKRSVAEASAYMKDRMLNEVSTMNDAVEQILVDPTLLEKGQAWTQKHAYFLQSAVDNTMSPIIWTAAYNQAIEEGSEARDAVRFADGVIRQTQGSTLPEDVSRFETGDARARFFTQFIGYFNMMANTNATAVSQIANEMGLRKGAGKLLYTALVGLLVPIWVAEAIAQAFRGGPGDEDDDGYLDDWLMAVFGLGTIRGLTATVPIAGQGAQMIVSRFNNNPADDKFSLSPAISLLEATMSSPFSVYNAIIEDGNAQKAVRDVAAAATLLTGLPFYAAARPVGYAAGVAQGKIEPTDAVDAVRGTVTGTASKESKTP